VRRVDGARAQWWQPHAEPHGPGPLRAGADAGAADARPVLANTDRRRDTRPWPSGQVTGASASAIERRASNTVSQSRQRYSYTGITTQTTNARVAWPRREVRR